MDVCLKPTFFEIFNPEWKQIKFASQNNTEWNGGDHGGGCGFYSNFDPIVNPAIIFIPINYFIIMKNGITIEHNSWKEYHEKYNFNKDNMGFMLDTYHDADPYKDFNPIYYFVSRSETQKWYDKNTGLINKLLIGDPKSVIHCIK